MDHEDLVHLCLEMRGKIEELEGNIASLQGDIGDLRNELDNKQDQE